MEDAGHIHHESHGEDAHGHFHEHKMMGDPQKVVKQIKKALEEREGCRVTLFDHYHANPKVVAFLLLF